MTPKVGDQVKVIVVSFAHLQSIPSSPAKDTYMVTELSGSGFYVEDKYYYDNSDVYKIYTPEKFPERFL